MITISVPQHAYLGSFYGQFMHFHYISNHFTSFYRNAFISHPRVDLLKTTWKGTWFETTWWGYRLEIGDFGLNVPSSTNTTYVNIHQHYGTTQSIMHHLFTIRLWNATVVRAIAGRLTLEFPFSQPTRRPPFMRSKFLPPVSSAVIYILKNR